MLRVTTLYASSAAATAKYYAQYLARAPGEVDGVREVIRLLKSSVSDEERQTMGDAFRASQGSTAS
jgi:hypothetical protein